VSAEATELSGPDFVAGVPFESIPDGGMIGGHANGQAVVLFRDGDDVSAIGGQCTHYGGPLADGIVVGHTVRCPWHHACFDLRTGEALHAPALNPVAKWEVKREGDTVKVISENPAADGATPLETPKPIESPPGTIIIIGAGAAGNAAAEMLRREAYAGKLTMIGADQSVPYDRPNLSKDYLAGNAPEEWIPLRPPEFYADHDIELIRDTKVDAIDASARSVTLSTGESRRFDKLLLATGAEPVRLPIPGADLPHVHYLRSLADSRAIISAAENAKHAVVIGASFIGLEVAASLRTRGLSVDVVAPEMIPLERVLGPELGAFVQNKHEAEGVVFHLGHTSTAITPDSVTLDDGSVLKADLVVVGVGVRPLTALAEKAGAKVDKGVVVNEYLETSIPGIFAAGDIARYPDPRSQQSVRIEHWVVAERQGQTAARNMLGREERFTSVPFFWSNHHETAITYVGHAEKWDEILVAGDLDEGSALIGYRLDGKILAVAATGREKESLEAEVALEEFEWGALDRLFAREGATV
jgi:NADPH-dependent 2,4-dienoyl-CoA reductase/sulfur reductase-like enzyme/nitrite reductase/ring-hydroxylating ferredoxin subunit